MNQIFTSEWMDEFKVASPNFYTEMLMNFRSSKNKFDPTGNVDQYHNIRIPYDFLSFLEEKMEKQHKAHLLDCPAFFQFSRLREFHTFSTEYMRNWETAIFEVAQDKHEANNRCNLQSSNICLQMKGLFSIQKY